MKKIIAVSLILTFVLSFVACGSNSPAVGVWKGQYQKFVGDSDDAKDTTPFTLTLKSNGKGSHERDGEEYDVKWEDNEGKITMTETFLGMSIEYTGSIENGELHLFNGDPEDDFTAEYVYVKEGE